MRKRISCLLLTMVMLFSLVSALGGTALAAGGFYDVDQNAWYLKYLDTAVDSGLINGRGDGRFAPNDDITGSEAVKLAACIGQLLTEGSVSLTNGSPWYASYMEYAVEEGILDAPLGQYALSAPITRAELMNMLCRAIPRGQRTQINSIPDGAIPDLYPSTPYRDNIYTLYRMGVVTGSDKRGSCLPQRQISRAEVATLVARIVDKDLRVAFQLEVSKDDPLNFTGEAALRAALEGEWGYCPPASDTPAAWIFFGNNGTFTIRLTDLKNNAIEEYMGAWKLDRRYAGANEIPDVLILTLYEMVEGEPVGEPTIMAGDFLIRRKTLCDERIVLELIQMNNGDSLFSSYYDDTAPVLKKYTGWTPQGETRKNESFCAAAWKVDYALKTVWLDDAAENGDNIGRYEALPYQAAPQMDLTSRAPQMLTDGSVWLVRTDELGRVTEMLLYSYYDPDEQLTEEEAAELLAGVPEVQQQLEQGMSILFDQRPEVIGGEPCVIISLGTNHGEQFVREKTYAVAPSGIVYVYDLLADEWSIIWKWQDHM